MVRLAKHYITLLSQLFKLYDMPQLQALFSKMGTPLDPATAALPPGSSDLMGALGRLLPPSGQAPPAAPVQPPRGYPVQ